MNLPDQYPPTARISEHAHLRMEEMHVPAKRVKRIVRDPHTRLATYANRYIATREDDREIAVVVTMDADGVPLVVTVIPRTYEPYDRRPWPDSSVGWQPSRPSS